MYQVHIQDFNSHTQPFVRLAVSLMTDYEHFSTNLYDQVQNKAPTNTVVISSSYKEHNFQSKIVILRELDKLMSRFVQVCTLCSFQIILHVSKGN